MRVMKKCPVCAVEVEDTAPFCNICGVNLAGAKDVPKIWTKLEGQFPILLYLGDDGS